MKRLDLLVVDDSSVMRKILMRTVMMGGLDVARFREAEHGAEALDAVREAEPDLIFLDINMPVMNGQAMLTALRAEARWQHIPVVVVSTEGNDRRRAAMVQLGAQFIHKPFTPEQIVATVRAVIGDSHDR